MDQKEEEITFQPGIKPDFETKKELKVWEEKYNKLSREDKILLETQEQTRLLKRTSNNVAFFFWLMVLSAGLSLFSLFILPNL